jgi:hypothetical protein
MIGKPSNLKVSGSKKKKGLKQDSHKSAKTVNQFFQNFEEKKKL